MKTLEPINQLTFEPLGRAAWRPGDQAVASSDAQSIIAYVELREHGGYDVAWVLHHGDIQRYPSLEAVLRTAVGMLAAPAPGVRMLFPSPVTPGPCPRDS